MICQSKIAAQAYEKSFQYQTSMQELCTKFTAATLTIWTPLFFLSKNVITASSTKEQLYNHQNFMKLGAILFFVPLPLGMLSAEIVGNIVGGLSGLTDSLSTDEWYVCDSD